MTIDEPLISCIVAIYNVESYLSECIQSIINQEYRNVEIILVNDGSTDGSLSICEKFAAKDSRIRVINQSNQGANCARNAGLYAAKGDWVYFADGDDYVVKDIFTYIKKCLLSENEIIMFSNIVLKNGIEKIKEYPIAEIRFDRKDKEDSFYELRLATMDRFGESKYNYKYLDAVSIWNKCYKRKFLISNRIEFVPGFPKCQDLTFNLKVYEKAKKGIFIDHPGYVYRINEKSVSNRFQENFIQKLTVMSEWFEEYMNSYLNDERMRTAYNGRMLTFLRTSTVLYFCNQNNQNTYRIRRKEFYDLLNKEPFKSASVESGIKTLPIQEKILSWCIKKKFFFLMEMLSIIKNIVKF